MNYVGKLNELCQVQYEQLPEYTHDTKYDGTFNWYKSTCRALGEQSTSEWFRNKKKANQDAAEKLLAKYNQCDDDIVDEQPRQNGWVRKSRVTIIVDIENVPKAKDTEWPATCDIIYVTSSYGGKYKSGKLFENLYQNERVDVIDYGADDAADHYVSYLAGQTNGEIIILSADKASQSTLACLHAQKRVAYRFTTVRDTLKHLDT